MSLRNLVKEELVSCVRGTPIADVAQMMNENDVGAVLVLENAKPVGIVTDRDIVLKCCTSPENFSLNRKVDEIMSTSISCVSVDDGIFDVIRAMKASKVRRVPICEEDGRAVGLVSFGDVFELLAEEMHDLAVPATPDHKKLRDTATESRGFFAH